MTVHVGFTIILLVLLAGLAWLDYETQASLRRTRELERILGVNEFTGLRADRDAPNARNVSETNGAAHGPSSPSLFSKAGADTTDGVSASAPALHTGLA